MAVSLPPRSGTKQLWEFVKPLMKWCAESNFSFHKSLLSAPAVSFAAREKHVNEDVMKFEEPAAHVKWKICGEYHETAPSRAVLEGEIHFWMGLSSNDACTRGGLMKHQWCFSLWCIIMKQWICQRRESVHSGHRAAPAIITGALGGL